MYWLIRPIDMHHCSLIYACTFNLNPPVVALNDGFDDGQSQSCSRNITRSCFIGTVKSLKEMREGMSRNPLTGNLKRVYHLVFVNLYRPRDRTTIWGVFQRIIQEIAKYQ